MTVGHGGPALLGPGPGAVTAGLEFEFKFQVGRWLVTARASGPGGLFRAGPGQRIFRQMFCGTQSSSVPCDRACDPGPGAASSSSSSDSAARRISHGD